jgi:spore coat polysaccharide biosynthesis protein SpsF
MNVVIVVQARMGSTRLQGKVMLPLQGAPLLQRMVERLQAVKTTTRLVVATTVLEVDDPIVELCEARNFDCYRGHPTDLLDRHYEAGKLFAADAVVKIPSDCPLIDPGVVDLVLETFIKSQGQLDFVSNLHPPTYPDGNDIEVIRMSALERAVREAKQPHEREHTTPYFWDELGRFRTANVRWPAGRDLAMSHRFTIDYPADYEFIRAVYEELWRPEKPVFSLEEILGLLDRRPDILAINGQFVGVNWYRQHLDRLKTISAADTREAPQ